MIHFIFKNKNWLKEKEWKNIYHRSSNQKRAEVVTLITPNRQKMSLQTKGRHFTMIRGSIHQEDIMAINIHVPKNRTPKYMK